MLQKLIFIDTETTGTTRVNGIIQIAGKVVFSLDGEFETKETFNFNVAPFDKDVIDLKALEINRKSAAEIQTYPKPADVYNDLCKLLGKYCDKFSRLDKMFFIGYNAKFDYDMLRAFFEKNYDTYFGSWFWTPPIDVMNMAAERLMDERVHLPNFKLETIVKHYGITADGDLHDAMTDIEVTEKLFYLFMKEKTAAFTP